MHLSRCQNRNCPQAPRAKEAYNPALIRPAAAPQMHFAAKTKYRKLTVYYLK